MRYEGGGSGRAGGSDDRPLVFAGAEVGDPVPERGERRVEVALDIEFARDVRAPEAELARRVTRRRKTLGERTRSVASASAGPTRLPSYARTAIGDRGRGRPRGFEPPSRVEPTWRLESLGGLLLTRDGS